MQHATAQRKAVCRTSFEEQPDEIDFGRAHHDRGVHPVFSRPADGAGLDQPDEARNHQPAFVVLDPEAVPAEIALDPVEKQLPRTIEIVVQRHVDPPYPHEQRHQEPHHQGRQPGGGISPVNAAANLSGFPSLFAPL